MPTPDDALRAEQDLLRAARLTQTGSIANNDTVDAYARVMAHVQAEHERRSREVSEQQARAARAARDQEVERQARRQAANMSYNDLRNSPEFQQTREAARRHRYGPPENIQPRSAPGSEERHWELFVRAQEHRANMSWVEPATPSIARSPTNLRVVHYARLISHFILYELLSTDQREFVYLAAKEFAANEDRHRIAHGNREAARLEAVRVQAYQARLREMGVAAGLDQGPGSPADERARRPTVVVDDAAPTNLSALVNPVSPAWVVHDERLDIPPSDAVTEAVQTWYANNVSSFTARFFNASSHTTNSLSGENMPAPDTSHLPPLPKPVTWLKPIDPTDPTIWPEQPLLEPPIDREFVFPADFERLKYNGRQFNEGLIFRNAAGKLRKATSVDRTSGSVQLGSVPMFGFLEQITGTSSRTRTNETRWLDCIAANDEMAKELPMYGLTAVQARTITMFFSAAERVEAPMLFDDIVQNAVKANSVTRIVFSSQRTKRGVLIDETYDGTRVCLVVHQSKIWSVFRLAAVKRIREHTYTHLIYHGGTFRFASGTENGGGFIFGKSSRDPRTVTEFAITGKFVYFSAMAPESLLHGYQGLLEQCQRCGARHADAGTAFRMVTLTDNSGDTSEQRVCTACDIHTCVHPGCGANVAEGYRLPNNAGYLCRPCQRNSYRRCQDCEILFDISMHSGNRLAASCPSCTRSRVECTECGGRFVQRAGRTSTTCPTCLNATIREYSYKPTPKFRLMPDNDSKRYYGIELEVENPTAPREELSEFAAHITRKLGNGLLYVKRDGSLSNGFEIVSHPFTERWFANEGRQMYGELLHYLSRNGFKSLETESCGMHIHVTRASMTPNALYRAQRFVAKNQELVCALSRRQRSNLDRWAAPSANCDTEEARQLASGRITNKRTRHAALNFTESTMEIRFPRGDIDPKGFNANLETAIALCGHADTIASDDQAENGRTFIDYADANADRYTNLVNHLFPSTNARNVLPPRSGVPVRNASTPIL